MQDMVHGAWIILVYFVIAASVMLTLRRLVRIPDELFRKILHFVLMGSYLLFASVFERWQTPVMLCAALIVIIYPLLFLAERIPGFSRFVNERASGEFKRSMVLAFLMLGVCIAVCWGWLGERYFGVACMYAWGVGDAFAALVGKRFGRHKITWRLADHRKSVEGSAAMMATSAIAVLLVMLLDGQPPVVAIAAALAGAGAATVVEMMTPNGMDTVTCPVAAMTVMIPLTALLGGF